MMRLSRPHKTLALQYLTIIALLLSPDGARAAETVIAAVPRNFPPYYVVEKSGRVDGFAIEIMDQLAMRSGINIKYRTYDNWAEVKRAVQRGEALIIPNIGILPERSSWLDFSLPIDTFTVSIWVRSNTHDINSAADLTGRSLAVVKTNIGESLAAKMDDTEILQLNDPQDALLMLLAGQIDALIYPDPVIAWIISSAKIEDRFKPLAQPLTEIKRAVAIRKGNPELLQRINTAAAELVGSQEYEKIHQKWFRTPAPFWSVRRVTMALGSILLLSITVLLLWRHLSILKINQHLRYNIKEKEDAQKERNHLIAAIEQAAEIILITKIDGKIIYVNPAFTTITGYEPHEVFGKNPRILKSGCQDEQFYTEMWRTLTNGHVWQGHMINRRKDGQLYEEDSSISPIKDRNGQIISFVAVKRDVTNEIRLEKQLRQSQKLEAIGTLAGGIAHDFNNILSIIMASTDIARESTSQDSINKYLDDIMGASVRAKDLVQQILSISRTTEPKLTPIMFNLVVKETLKLLRASIPATITIKSQVDTDCKIMADPTMIHQIVVNLATNAYHALKESGGTLTVNLQQILVKKERILNLPTGTYAKLIVSDDGPGIEHSLLERIFDPYFTTKAQGEGTGLGLSIVQRIVNQLHGLITVYSELGEGTTFNVYLPTLNSETQAVDAACDNIPTGSEQILLVEDEDILRNIMQELLQSLGYRVTSYSDPQDALNDVRTYDLLITDLTMPHMTGLELTRRLHQLNPQLPVILYSGFFDEEMLQKARDAGIDRYLQKPVLKETLASTIRQILDGEPS